MADTHSTEAYSPSPWMLLGDPVLGEEHLGEVAPGVKAVYRWRTRERYFGTKQALIASGLAQPSWFPGEPGQKKSVGRAVREGRPLTIRASGQTREGGKYLLEIGMTDAENAQAASQHRQERKVEARKKEADRLSMMAEDHKRFRELAMGYVFMHSKLQQSGLPPEFPALWAAGHSFAQETVDAYNDALIKAIDVLRNGAVLFSESTRAEITNEIRAETAKTDDVLQTFLRKATGASVRGGRNAKSC